MIVFFQVAETEEFFTVILSNATGGAQLGESSTVEITIAPNDFAIQFSGRKFPKNYVLFKHNLLYFTLFN